MPTSITVNRNVLRPYEASNSRGTQYRIHLNKGENGWIVVTSPDIPNLITQGKDEDEAVKNAVEVVELLVEEKLVDKEFNLLIYSKF
jgi:predicted RNase H-like HicB family nuclease